MDDSVRRAIARWPNVPAVYGWLRLDRRGRWSVRVAGGDDERVMHRTAGTFQPITNPQMAAFIGRNYERDADGAYYFQNGPQRVFVAFDYTPYVYRLADDRAGLIAHTGVPSGAIAAAEFDESGAMVIDAAAGPGVLLDRDLGAILELLRDASGGPIPDDLLEAAATAGAPLQAKCFGAALALGRVTAADLPARFGYVQAPVPRT